MSYVTKLDSVERLVEKYFPGHMSGIIAREKFRVDLTEMLPKWVGVDERLPETFQHVLVCLKSVPNGPDWYPRTNTFLGWQKRGIWFGSFVNPLTGVPESGEFPEDIITHWMELPAPPERLAVEEGTKGEALKRWRVADEHNKIGFPDREE
jgi:hypothetical protein